MLKIGITGGIGVGKSVVCKIFAALGIPVYDADSAAKRLTNQDPDLRQAIVQQFGEGVYQANGEFDRQAFTQLILSHPQTAKQLEALVHPAVGRDFAAFVAHWQGQTPARPYLLKEAALLYEAGSYKELDKMIVVTADLPTRIDRIRQRDTHRTQSQIEGIIAKQMPDAEKIKRADFLIDNGSNALLIPQVLAIHKKLIVNFKL